MLELLKLAYILIAVLGCVRSLSRNFDVVSTAFGGTLVYSFPVLTSSYSLYVTFIYTLTLLFLLLTMRFSRSCQRGIGFHKNIYPAVDTSFLMLLRYVRLLSLGLTTLFALRMFGTSLSLSSEVMFYIRGALVVSVCIYLFAALSLRKGLDVVLVIICFLPIILAGDRTQFVISVLVSSVGASIYLDATPKRLFNQNKLITTLLVVTVFVVGFFGKIIYGAYEDVSRGFSFLEAVDIRLTMFRLQPENNIESFHVVNMFDLIVNGNLRISPTYLLFLPLMFLPFTYGSDINSHYITNIIKDKFYSGWSDETGVSANPFAESFMAFGDLGPIIFCFGYVFVVFILNIAVRRSIYSGRFWLGVLLIQFSVFWAFYFHRSSLFQIIAHWKRVFFVILMLYVGYFIFKNIYKSFRSKPTRL